MIVRTDASAFLHRVFSDSSNMILEHIFEEANDRRHKPDLSLLQDELLSVLQAERSMFFIEWNTLPSGNARIVCAQQQCFLINIYGILPLFSNYLLLNGEMGVTHCRWMEGDSLVVFDIVRPVSAERQEVVCHYTNDEDAFVHFGPIKKTEKEKPDEEDIDLESLGEWY